MPGGELRARSLGRPARAARAPRGLRSPGARWRGRAAAPPCKKREQAPQPRSSARAPRRGRGPSPQPGERRRCSALRLLAARRGALVAAAAPTQGAAGFPRAEARPQARGRAKEPDPRLGGKAAKQSAGAPASLASAAGRRPAARAPAEPPARLRRGLAALASCFGRRQGLQRQRREGAGPKLAGQSCPRVAKPAAAKQGLAGAPRRARELGRVGARPAGASAAPGLLASPREGRLERAPCAFARLKQRDRSKLALGGEAPGREGSQLAKRGWGELRPGAGQVAPPGAPGALGKPAGRRRASLARVTRAAK